MVKDELIGVIWRGRDTYSDREVVCDLICNGYMGGWSDKAIQVHREKMERDNPEHLLMRKKALDRQSCTL